MSRFFSFLTRFVAGTKVRAEAANSRFDDVDDGFAAVAAELDALGDVGAMGMASVNLASNPTTLISTAASTNIILTGTATITAFDTMSEGTTRRVTAAGAFTMTHNATSLILPGGANITAAVNDTFVLKSKGSGNWQVIDYTRASGQPVKQIQTAGYEDQSVTAPKLANTLDLSSKSVTLPANSVTPAMLTGGVGGYSRVIGLTAVNNSGTPVSQYDIDCEAVILFKPSDESLVTVVNPGAAITCNVGTAGPIANGRDQAGAFSSSSWIHFYLIWNGTTLATLASASAPPSGPTLPTGYTHWAYVGPDYFTSSSELVETYLRGARAYYKYRQLGLNGGTQTTDTAVNLASVVPPNAGNWRAELYMTATSSGGGVWTHDVILSILGGGGSNAQCQVAQNLSGLANSTIMSQRFPGIEMPNVGQQFYYRNVVGAGSSASATIYILGYSIPNGGE